MFFFTIWEIRPVLAAQRRLNVFIRIRKERFGYVLFDRYSRNPHFVETTIELEQLSRNEVGQFLLRYYPSIDEKFHHEFVPSRDLSLELSAPIGMYMEIAQRCTLNCGHCYKQTDPGSQFLDLAAWKRLIKELHDIGVFEIRLCGNEPTASPHFREICEFISRLDMLLGVNTNGFFGRKVQDELISLRPDFIAVSIDGDETSHDRIRGSGSYGKAVKLLERLNKTNIKRRINTVVSALTLKTIEHTARLANKHGCDVSFLPFRPVGRNQEFNAACAISKQQMRQAVEDVMRFRYVYPHLVLLTYFDVLGEKATYHHSMDCNKPCSARKNGFIAYNGDFYPCDFLRYLGKVYYCGNATDAGFWPIWTSSQELMRFRNLKHDKCNHCKHYMTKCYGGCISGSIASSGCPDDELCFIDV